MSKQNHSYSVEDAIEYGTECATLMHHFKFWIDHNKALGRNFYDGRTWMYQTQKEISAYYPYWKEDAVNRIITKLIDKGVLITGNYNKSKFDKTLWYAFKNEEKFTIPRNRGIDSEQSRNPIREIAEPIPDTKPNTNQIEKEIKKDSDTPSSSPFVNKELFKKERAPNVYVPDEEHQRLIHQIGEEMTEACYKELSEWKEATSKEKWKKNDYRSIINWVINAVIERREKEKIRNAHLSKEKIKDVENHNKPEIVENRAISERIRGIVEQYEIPLKKIMLVRTNSVSFLDKTKDYEKCFSFENDPKLFKSTLLREAKQIFPRAEEELKKIEFN